MHIFVPKWCIVGYGSNHTVLPKSKRSKKTLFQVGTSTRDANHYSFCLVITHFGTANLYFCLIQAKEIGEIKQKFYKFVTILSYIKHYFGCIAKLLSILKIEC